MTVFALGCAIAAASPCDAQTATPSAVSQDNPKTKAPGAPLAKGANSFAESQARALLQAKGYSEVSALVNDSSGIWRGTAIKDQKKVDVSVDFQGHVAAQ